MSWCPVASYLAIAGSKTFESAVSRSPLQTFVREEVEVQILQRDWSCEAHRSCLFGGRA